MLVSYLISAKPEKPASTDFQSIDLYQVVHDGTVEKYITSSNIVTPTCNKLEIVVLHTRLVAILRLSKSRRLQIVCGKWEFSSDLNERKTLALTI
jgi:hypothetical protein